MASLTRRRLMLAGATAAAGLTAPARAQTFPSRPIRLVVPGGAGGSPDIVARIFAGPFGEALGQTVIVENVAGAAGILGTDKVAKAEPDGHTLLYGFQQVATMNPALYPDLPYKPERDLAPVGMTLDLAYMLIASPKFAANDLAQLAAMAKARPRAITYASTGVGSAAHLGVVLLENRAGVEMLHVPYRAGAAANTDIMSGVVDLRLDAVAASLALARSGAVKVLAVTTPNRLPELPGVPTVAESFPGFELLGWQGVWAPAGTPAAVVQKLSAALLAVVGRRDVRAQIAGLSYAPTGSTPEQMAAAIRKETAQWADIVKNANISAQ